MELLYKLINILNTSDETEPSWLEPELKLKDFELGSSSARLVTFFSSARKQKSAKTSRNFHLFNFFNFLFMYVAKS